MKTKIHKINPNVCLPPDLVVENVDDNLYRIGLCPHSVRERPKLRPIDHPLCAFVVVSLFLVERVATCALPDQNYYLQIKLGSMGHLLGVGQQLDLCFILVSILSLSSQAIYYLNHRNGVKPAFLRLFQMLSGSLASAQVGLSKTLLILQMCNTYRKWFVIMEYNTHYGINIFPTFVSMLTYAWRCTWRQAMLFGIPNTILFAL